MQFDIAVCFGSAYVMDDTDFVRVFRALKRIGVKELVDFHAGYMDLKHFCFNLLGPISKNRTVRKMFGKSSMIEDEYIGKFHGYSRNRAELRRLYREANLKVLEETSVGGYKYVAIVK